MKRYKCIVEYDGKGFNGWQSQPHKNTIQQSIEIALKKVTRKTIKIFGSGRTDSGFMPLVKYFTLTTMVGYKPLKFWRNKSLSKKKEYQYN